MLSFKQYNFLIFESFKDAERIWKNNTDSTQYIDKFKLLRSRKQLSGKESDIGYWIKQDFDDFKKFVDNKLLELDKKTPLKKKASDSDSPIVFENDEVYVHHIKTKAASCKLGSNTDWCITKQNQSYWEQYTDNDITFYFIIKKNPVGDNYDKLAVSVYPKSLSTKPSSDSHLLNDNIIQVWNIKDENISYQFPIIVKELNIPVNIFKEVEDTTPFVMIGNKKIKYKEENGIRVYKHIKIDKMNLSKLPDFGDNHIVTGDFFCYFNQLTTLEGSPKTVGGDFFCGDNQLTTLEGSPKTVGGDFSCNYNQLTTLEGSPNSVGGDFSCKNNKKKFTEEEVREVCDVKGKVVV